MEALHALYCRSQYQDDDFISLICPLYEADSVNLLKKIYEWSMTDATDIDHDKYLLAKKFSEVSTFVACLVQGSGLLADRDRYR